MIGTCQVPKTSFESQVIFVKQKKMEVSTCCVMPGWKCRVCKTVNRAFTGLSNPSKNQPYVIPCVGTCKKDTPHIGTVVRTRVLHRADEESKKRDDIRVKRMRMKEELQTQLDKSRSERIGLMFQMNRLSSTEEKKPLQDEFDKLSKEAIVLVKKIRGDE